MRIKRRTQQWVLLVGLGLFGLLGLLLILLAVANHVTSSRLKETIAWLESEGFRTSPEGIMPECADEDNALIPWQEGQAQFSLKTDAARSADMKAIRDWRSLRKEDKDALREACAVNEPVLELIREAVSRPCFTFRPDYTKPMYTWQWPRLFSLIQMMRVLVIARGRLALEDGKREEALECCLLGVQGARSLAQFADFVSWIFCRLILSYSLGLCEEAIPGGPLAEEMGLKLIERLDPQYFKECISRDLDVKRLTVLDAVIRDKSGYRRALGFNQDPELVNLLMDFWGQPIYTLDLVESQHLMVRLIKAVKQPHWRARDVYREVEEESRSLHKIPLVSDSWTPYLVARGLEKHAITEVRAQVTRVAIACKLHQQKSGSYPASLEELAPEYFEKIPRDPFTGNAFIYRLLPEGGFVLYSVGPDEKDNGGTYFLPDERRQLLRARRTIPDDIVWQENPR